MPQIRAFWVFVRFKLVSFMWGKINDPFVIDLFKNLKWQSLSLLVRALVSLLSLGLIAGIAGPETVGAYGVVWVFVFGCYSMILGLSGQSLISLKKIEQGHLNACFFIVLVLSLSLALVGYGLIFGTDILDVPVNVKEGFALGFITLPVMCLAVVENSNLQRQLNFKRFAVITTLATFISACVAILIALYISPLLALFALTGFIGIVQFIIYRLTGYEIPLGKFNSKQLTEIWHTGKHFALNSVSGVMWVNSPQVLFSVLFSLDQVGIFVLCRRLVEMIATQVSGLVNSVIFPSFSSIREDLDRISSVFQKCNFYIASLMMVPLLLIGSSSSDFLMLYAGSEWSSGGEILFLIVLMQIGLNFGQTVFPTFQSLGNLSIPWKWNFGLMAVQITSIFILGAESLEASVSILAASTGLMPIVVYKLSKQLNFAYSEWLGNMTLVAIFGLVVLVVSRLFDVLLQDFSIYLRVLIVSLSGCFIYGGLFASFKMHKTYM